MEAPNNDQLRTMFSKLEIKDPAAKRRAAMNKTFGTEIDTSKRISHDDKVKPIDPPPPPITLLTPTEKK